MRQFNLGSSPLMRSLVEPHVGEYQEPVRQSIVGTMVLLVVRICHNRTGGSFQVIHDQDDNGSTSDTSLPQLSTCNKRSDWFPGPEMWILIGSVISGVTLLSNISQRYKGSS